MSNIIKTQQDINLVVNSISCIRELNSIKVFLHKKAISSQIEKFLMIKKLDHPQNIEWLTNLILFKSFASIKNKYLFCNQLMEPNTLLPNINILKNRNLVLDDNISIALNPVFHDIKEDIMNKTDFQGLGTANIGKGEVFFLLLSQNVQKGRSGDLLIDSYNIEVKGQCAGARGQKGYNSPNNVGPIKIFEEYLNLTLDTRRMGFVQYQNFNKALLKSYNCNNLKNSLVQCLDSFFSKMYTNSLIYNNIKNTYLPKMVNDQGLLHSKSIIYLTALQIEYYMKIESIDSILFLNPKTFKSIRIDSSKEFIKYHEHFKISQFAWTGTGTRTSVNPISYLG
ncbi:MAG: hypothetical protein QM489_00865 [Candidatus Izemoplasma sp.]